MTVICQYFGDFLYLTVYWIFIPDSELLMCFVSEGYYLAVIFVGQTKFEVSMTVVDEV